LHYYRFFLKSLSSKSYKFQRLTLQLVIYIFMTLSVQLLAMSQSSLRNISGFIKTKGKNHFVLSDAPSAKVIILDIDNTEGKLLLSKLQDSQVHIITLSLFPKSNTHDSTIQIKKPFTGNDLLQAANTINNAKKSNAIRDTNTQSGNTHPSNLGDSDTYDPSHTLQGMLRKAIQLSDTEGTPVLLEVMQYRIEINFAQKQATLNFLPKRLRTLCYFPLNNRTCVIKKGALHSSFDEYHNMPIAELSWNTALLCSRGRLPINISESALYKLKAWPNLTRWSVPDNALKISSLWSKSSSSITAISQQLAIPITNVRSFITAALDSNLAAICDVTSEIVPLETKKNNSALFIKLLNRLKRAQ